MALKSRTSPVRFGLHSPPEPPLELPPKEKLPPEEVPPVKVVPP